MAGGADDATRCEWSFSDASAQCSARCPTSTVGPESGDDHGVASRREARQNERQDERETFGRGGDATRYQMREKMLSIGDDSWIEDARRQGLQGQRQGAAAAPHPRHRGRPRRASCRIQDARICVREVMEIEGADGGAVADGEEGADHAAARSVHRRSRRRAAVGAGEHRRPRVRDRGRRQKVAEVSKKWFRVRDTYGVEVAPGLDMTRSCSPSPSHRLDGAVRATDPQRRRASSPPGGSVRHMVHLTIQVTRVAVGSAPFRCESRGHPHVPPPIVIAVGILALLIALAPVRAAPETTTQASTGPPGEEPDGAVRAAATAGSARVSPDALAEIDRVVAEHTRLRRTLARTSGRVRPGGWRRPWCAVRCSRASAIASGQAGPRTPRRRTSRAWRAPPARSPRDPSSSSGPVTSTPGLRLAEGPG